MWRKCTRSFTNVVENENITLVDPVDGSDCFYCLSCDSALSAVGVPFFYSMPIQSNEFKKIIGSCVL
ncbi:unnamed protein product [Prunus armeniaca]|uniref:Uncharacterized protein n=1 Tax=Prunus armeniaca TaxID=36596 RepID=A0A6J5U5Y6_PRUAR|nr:unnamed protein product [Prunus armeniaca]